MASDRQPALRTRGRARSLPDDESERKQRHGKQIERRRHPLDEAHRRVSNAVSESESDKQPQQLRLISMRNGSRSIRLTCRVNHRHTEYRKKSGSSEKLVIRNDRSAHQPSSITA